MKKTNLKKSSTLKQKLTIQSVLLFVLFTVLAIITLLPFYSIFLASLRPGTEIMRQGIGLDIDLSIMSFKNYANLFSGETPYLTWFFNSVFITVVQTALTLLVSAFVAYGFAMYNFRFKNVLFTCVLIIMMIPMEIIMLPLYQLIIKLGLINSIWGIILPFVAGALPIFFFRQYLTGIPKDFLDAARIDGCSEYGTFFRVIMPLMKPSFAAMGIFVGMNSWNNFLWPMIVLGAGTKQTLTIGLNTLITPYGNNYDVLIAGSVFSVIPIVILFIVFQKHFIAGMTAGGVKG
ncbi:MAG: carbohydrate ABC transporter permease [Clostridiales bacterium]|jgi:arabinosaccharide transport system permease protein|nr:carbohydrate ABC transporter permease [Clostridiales bacterium]